MSTFFRISSRSPGLILAFALALVGMFVLGNAPSLAAEPEKQVAGRTLSEWTQDLRSDNPTIKLRAAQSLSGFGAAARQPLISLLSDEDPAARYLAASHLGDLGATAASAKSQLIELQTDQSPAVRMAVAYALAKIDPSEANVSELAVFLQYPERGMACSAAEMLGRIGPPAAIALPALEKAREHSDYHLKGASLWAMWKIRGKEAVK